MPLSPRQSKFNHYLGYLHGIVYLVVGVVLIAMPFVAGRESDLETKVILGLLGLGLCGWGAFSLWRHSRLDPAALVPTIDDLPVDQRIRALRRFMLLVPAAFTPAAALVGYELAQLEYGWAERVSVWAPVAFVYNTFGFWPAVLFIPAVGLLLVIYLAAKLRSIKNRTRHCRDEPTRLCRRPQRAHELHAHACALHVAMAGGEIGGAAAHEVDAGRACIGDAPSCHPGRARQGESRDSGPRGKAAEPLILGPGYCAAAQFRDDKNALRRLPRGAANLGQLAYQPAHALEARRRRRPVGLVDELVVGLQARARPSTWP